MKNKLYLTFLSLEVLSKSQLKTRMSSKWVKYGKNIRTTKIIKTTQRGSDTNCWIDIWWLCGDSGGLGLWKYMVTIGVLKRESRERGEVSWEKTPWGVCVLLETTNPSLEWEGIYIVQINALLSSCGSGIQWVKTRQSSTVLLKLNYYKCNYELYKCYYIIMVTESLIGIFVFLTKVEL